MAKPHFAWRRTRLEVSSVKWYRIGAVTRSTMKLGWLGITFDGDDSGNESRAQVAQPLEPLTNSHVD
jgi:hypothetical protein